MTVTFFGHRKLQTNVDDRLHSVLVDLIENCGADTFYVGNHGEFDSAVAHELQKLEKEYPHIKYFVVLAYLPSEKKEYTDYSHTIYPEGLEKCLPRFAISKRNEWMVKQSDTVVTYVTHTWGGAYKFKTLAKNKKKRVIEISE